eukprot:scaffold2519_cov108-Isochrysis_galbana.AAC.2
MGYEKHSESNFAAHARLLHTPVPSACACGRRRRSSAASSSLPRSTSITNLAQPIVDRGHSAADCGPALSPESLAKAGALLVGSGGGPAGAGGELSCHKDARSHKRVDDMSAAAEHTKNGREGGRVVAWNSTGRGWRKPRAMARYGSDSTSR